MTSSTKCRAKDPLTCTDPDCPEKRAAMDTFYAPGKSETAAMSAVLKMAGGASKLPYSGEKNGYNLIFDLVDAMRYTNTSKQDLIKEAVSFYRNNRDIALPGYKTGMRRAIKALKQS